MEENWLRVYYMAPGSGEWAILDTSLDTYHNTASAPAQGEGLYALMSSLEIPPSYWGREEKPCPNCGKTILAAAVRCRHCGAVFSSATPQGVTAYSDQQKIKAKIPADRTASIWLLVFSLVPCTAPLAAIVGLIWYIGNHQPIRALPPLNVALCKIAVGVALAQTGLLIVCGILASVANG